MTTKYINNLTLDCLLNKNILQKITNNKYEINEKDKKFYKKRIYLLFKNLLNNEIDKDDIFFSEINKTFEYFVYSSIRYFKSIDKNDILQEEYIDLVIEQHHDIKENIEDYKLLEINNKFIHYNNEFNKKINVEKQNIEKHDIIYPIKKKINLKHPKLKIKGLNNGQMKKNNINTNYETMDKENEEIQEIIKEIVEQIIKKQSTL
jgi:hypothetical protein